MSEKKNAKDAGEMRKKLAITFGRLLRQPIA